MPTHYTHLALAERIYMQSQLEMGFWQKTKRGEGIRGLSSDNFTRASHGLKAQCRLLKELAGLFGGCLAIRRHHDSQGK